jgi:TonB family protein
MLGSARRTDDYFGRMLAISMAAHVAVLALIALAPEGWGRGDSRRETTRMVISLGGTPGPRSGGMTPIAGRAVQELAPPDVKPAPVTPPPPKAPEMVLPEPSAKPRPQPPSKAPDDAKGRRTTTGDEIRPGTAVAETGAKGSSFGLTTGGGGTGGYLDVGDFCCPEYLATMRQLIERNWRPSQSVAGTAQVKFVIQRNGMLTDVELEKRSGYFALDTAALRAIAVTKQLPPLPAAFTEDYLTVHLVFQYQR